MSNAVNVSPLKQWMDEQWAKPGVKFSGHGVAYIGTGLKDMQVRAGAQRNYKSKAQRDYEKRFALYNEKLKPIILAEATATPKNVEVTIIDNYGRPVKKGNVIQTEVRELKEYVWPKFEKAPIAGPEIKQATTKKRVTKTKVAQAASIFEKVPSDSLPAFLSRFNLPAAIAASIIAAGNTNEMAKLFLQSTLNA